MGSISTKKRVTLQTIFSESEAIFAVIFPIIAKNEHTYFRNSFQKTVRTEQQAYTKMFVGYESEVIFCLPIQTDA